jgi:hypothetical protein
MIVTDPDGQRVLNLTKLVFEGDMQSDGFGTSDIQEMLQLIVEAAEEWSA